jgi:hypothetical protein
MKALFFAILVSSFALTAWAEDLDTQVHDIKLRTTSGAKSKYSSSLNMVYSGASLSEPFGDKRPNIAEGRRPSPVSLSGNVAIRYRKNIHESFTVGTGISRERPFHAREHGEQLEVNTPHLGYNNTYALDDTQISSSFRLYITTLDYARAVGEVGTLGYSLSTMNKLGQSRFSGGVSAILSYTAYDTSKGEIDMGPGQPKANIQTMQTDYGFSLTPSLQYAISDRFNLTSSLSLLNYYHYRSESPTDFAKQDISATLGAGYAIYRDFYLSPYFSFMPNKMLSDKTSVNLMASINL